MVVLQIVKSTYLVVPLSAHKHALDYKSRMDRYNHLSRMYSARRDAYLHEMSLLELRGLSLSCYGWKIVDFVGWN